MPLLITYFIIAGIVSAVVQIGFIWVKMWQPVDPAKRSPLAKYVVLSFVGLGWPILLMLSLIPGIRQRLWKKLME